MSAQVSIEFVITAKELVELLAENYKLPLGVDDTTFRDLDNEGFLAAFKIEEDYEAEMRVVVWSDGE